MKNIIWFCAIVQLCFVLGNASGGGRVVTVRNCGKSYGQPRISGGTPVRAGIYPWMVALNQHYGRKFYHICGGSILNERWIVTAAHCIRHPNNPEKYEIFVGVNHVSTETSDRVARHKISKIILHEGYNENARIHNDIALLKTVDPIDFGGSEGFVNGICLPAMNQEFMQARAMVTGWNYADDRGVGPVTLHEDFVYIIKPKKCISKRRHVTRNMICAGSSELHSCQWQVDSGESLILWPYGRAVLVGIVSSGTTCATKEKPAIYTKVSSYVNWIEKHINAD